MEKICTTEKEIHEILENLEKYLAKHGLESLMIVVDSKRCETISVLKKKAKKMDVSQLSGFLNALLQVENMIRTEYLERIDNATDY